MAALEINIEFAAARSRAKELGEAASELRKIAGQQYCDAINQLHSAWSSDYSNEYMIKANQLKDKMLESAKKLDEIARDITDSVKRLEDAERSAREIARLRTFHT